MKRVLLTGASGFVGSHVLRHILANTDWQVVCPATYQHKGMYDRVRQSMEGFNSSRVKVFQHDLTAPITPVTAKEIGRIDYVLNVASQSHVDRSIEEPTPFIVNNVYLICNLLDWARNSDIEKFVQISTDEVYGPAPDGYGHTEWVDLHLPSNPYAASKAAQENIAFSYWRTYGVPLIITNTMNIIGEMQDPEKFMPKTLSKVLRDESMEIHASPAGRVGSRFYLHARNQADALLYILNNIKIDNYSDTIDRPKKFHVVGEREVDNLEMAQMIASAAGKELKYELVDFHSSRPGHDLRYALNGSLLAQAGWKSPIPLEESLERTVKWTLDHPEWLNI